MRILYYAHDQFMVVNKPYFPFSVIETDVTPQIGDIVTMGEAGGSLPAYREANKQLPAGSLTLTPEGAVDNVAIVFKVVAAGGPDVLRPFEVQAPKGIVNLWAKTPEDAEMRARQTRWWLFD